MQSVGSTERERAELAKIRLEAEQIEADLEQRKDQRRYETGVNRVAWLRYSITVLLALLVPVGGWVLTARGQQSTERIAVGQRDDDLYYRILEAFGSSSSTARQGAAAALGSYAKAGLHNNEHAPETTALLANRLTSETDSGVLDEVITSLGSLPASSIPEVVRANRLAALQYARTLGRAVALQSIGQGYRRTDPNKTDNLTRTVRGAIYAEVSGAETPLEREPVNPESTLDLAHLTTVKPLFTAYESERSRVVANSDITQKRARDGSADALRKVEDSVRSLAATSTALVRLMRANSGKLAGADLRDIVVLDGDLRNLDLRSTNLSYSNLQGSAVQADFSFSDLAGASLSKLALRDALGHRAIMHAAGIDGTIFSSKGNLPDLAGSYWWRARLDISTDIDETATAPLKDLDSTYLHSKAIADCKTLRAKAKISARSCDDST